MARRRMFSLDIIDTDVFLEMPASAQNLYFHLGMRGDDDGFIASPRKIMKSVNASDDDMKILLAKQFVIPFDTGICVIRHWRIHNYIQNDRYNETHYKEEKKQLTIQDNVYTLDTTGIQGVSGLETQVRIGKVRIGKGNKIALPSESPTAHSDKSKKPTLEEVSSFFDDSGFNKDPENFFNYWESVDWTMGNGRKIKDWKAAARNYVKKPWAPPAPPKKAPVQLCEHCGEPLFDEHCDNKDCPQYA